MLSPAYTFRPSTLGSRDVGRRTVCQSSILSLTQSHCCILGSHMPNGGPYTKTDAEKSTHRTLGEHPQAPSSCEMVQGPWAFLHVGWQVAARDVYLGTLSAEGLSVGSDLTWELRQARQRGLVEAEMRGRREGGVREAGHQVSHLRTAQTGGGGAAKD